MPYINVNDAYILDNTGKQVDDAVDYALANSNRNLLDNPWFTVNQRGFTTGITGSGLTVDRWRSDNANISLSNGVISIPANATFKQIIDTNLYNFLVGKTVTLSCMLSDGTIQSGTVVVPSTGSTYAPNTPRLALNGTNKQFHIYPPSAVSIRAFKLELGSYSTLANDVPPDYKTELDKCQYYCRVIQGTSFIAVGQAVAPTVIRFPLPYVMRARPTATLTGAAQVYGQGGPLTPSALSCTGNTTQCIEISTTVSGATAGQSYMLVFSGANDKIVISADL